jgi:chaperonin GroEL (HSP60 family)
MGAEIVMKSLKAPARIIAENAGQCHHAISKCTTS